MFHKEIGITLLALINSKLLPLISRQNLELQAKKMPVQRAGRHVQVFHKEIGITLLALINSKLLPLISRQNLKFKAKKSQL